MVELEKKSVLAEPSPKAKLPLAVDLNVSAEMRRRGFLRPDIQELTHFGSERLLAALEAQTNVICQTNSFPPVELRIIKPQAVGRSREALSVPIQGMLSLHGLKVRH
jgi:hypothetical protein